MGNNELNLHRSMLTCAFPTSSIVIVLNTDTTRQQHVDCSACAQMTITIARIGLGWPHATGLLHKYQVGNCCTL